MSEELREQIQIAIAQAWADTQDLTAMTDQALAVVAPLLAEKDAEIERLTAACYLTNELHRASLNSFTATNDKLVAEVRDVRVERDAARAELDDLKAKAAELLDAVAEPHEFDPPEACNEVEGEDLNQCLECGRPRAAHTLAARLMDAAQVEVKRLDAELQRRLAEVVSDGD